MIRSLFSIYSPQFPQTVVYMLQSTEYQPLPYLKWLWRTSNFSTVMHRRRLDKTKAARLLLLALYSGVVIHITASLLMVFFSTQSDHAVLALALLFGGIGLLVWYPIVWAHLIVVPLILGRLLIVRPKERKLIEQSKKIFAEHPGITIGVAGSYGKTTMKEMLVTVLREGKRVAATPANKNVAISHAYFARKLTGEEDVVIVEYGEGAPGDVKRFVKTTQPDIGVITGLAPAHLDKYKTLAAAGDDIFSLAEALKPENVHVNGDSPMLKAFLKPGYHLYTSHSTLGWKVSDVSIGFDGTKFLMKRGNNTLKLHSGFLGRHQVGPLAFAAALGFEFGLSKEQIEAGISKTRPVEHRMQPMVVGGAWIINDGYNGNIEGMRAGLELLKELPGKRKIYVTPGLVDQGDETESVHHRLGKEIAEHAPDKLVLMKNSVTNFIHSGLSNGGYKGEIQIVEDPLEYYSSLEHMVAVGDVVLLQNDWTDNYQ